MKQLGAFVKRLFAIFLCFISVPAYCTDTKSTELFPPMTKRQIAIGATVAILGSTALDQVIRDHLFPYRNVNGSKDLRLFGNAVQVSGPIIGSGFLLEGMAFHNPKSKETAVLSYESFIIAGALDSIIKFTVGRRRPDVTGDSFNFKPGNIDSSFPSGHTTEAFAAATVFSEQYPHWYVVIPSYTAAAATGFSRMYANKHWLSDVVAGAILGTTVSHFLRVRKKHARGNSWRVETNGTDLRLVRLF